MKCKKRPSEYPKLYLYMGSEEYFKLKDVECCYKMSSFKGKHSLKVNIENNNKIWVYKVYDYITKAHIVFFYYSAYCYIGTEFTKKIRIIK